MVQDGRYGRKNGKGFYVGADQWAQGAMTMASDESTISGGQGIVAIFVGHLRGRGTRP